MPVYRVQLTEQYIPVRGEFYSSTATARARRRSRVGPRGRPGLCTLEGDGQHEQRRPHLGVASRALGGGSNQRSYTEVEFL